jgi:DNA (cytosine-5)-methyltransferase 1
LERAGMEVRWQSEIDPYACRVLAKHWPHVPNLGDIKLIDWENVERVDLVCGGYPCQPFSYAGKRQGEADPRHLWPFFAECIRRLRPRFALLENVPGHRSKGFGRVLGDLAEIGYDAEWDSVPAAAVGAPHRRDRVFVVAYPRGSRRREDPRGAHADEGQHAGRSALQADQLDGDGEGRRARHVAHADNVGRDGWSGIFWSGRRGEPTDRRQWPAEPNVGRVANGVPKRVDRLRVLGNGVVPQVSEYVGRQIMAVTLAAD